MRKIIAITAIVFLFVQFADASIQESPDLQAAITNGLAVFMPHVTLPTASKFDPKVGHMVYATTPVHVDIKQCFVGAALPVARISQDALKHYQPSQSVSSMLQPPDSWFIPVWLGSTNIGMLRVIKTQTGYYPDAFGYAPLQGKITSIFLKWKRPAYHIQLIAVEGRMEYCFTIKELTPTNLAYVCDDPTPSDAITVVPSLIGYSQGGAILPQGGLIPPPGAYNK